MHTRRGHGRAEGSAPDSRTDRAEAATSGSANRSATDPSHGAWAPAEKGGRLVSLDEDQFAALVRPLLDARRQPPPANAE